jgi:hypothetical protein
MMAHVVRLHANVFSRQKLFFMDAIREYFTSFVEQRVLFKFHDEKFFVATQIALIASRSVSTRMFQDGPFDFVWAIAFLQTSNFKI